MTAKVDAGRRDWLRTSSVAKKEIHRLRAIRRSWLLAHRHASNQKELRAVAREVRRWMRPWLRVLRREARDADRLRVERASCPS